MTRCPSDHFSCYLPSSWPPSHGKLSLFPHRGEGRAPGLSPVGNPLGDAGTRGWRAAEFRVAAIFDSSRERIKGEAVKGLRARRQVGEGGFGWRRWQSGIAEHREVFVTAFMRSSCGRAYSYASSIHQVCRSRPARAMNDRVDRLGCGGVGQSQHHGIRAIKRPSPTNSNVQILRRLLGPHGPKLSRLSSAGTPCVNGRYSSMTMTGDTGCAAEFDAAV